MVSATQVGKTFSLACWLLAGAWTDGEKPTHPSWWMAPVYNQVEQGHRLVHKIASSAGIVRSSVMTPYPSITLVNGARIEFRSWEREQNLMGTTISRAVVDEAGLLNPEAQAAISSRRSGTMGPIRYIGNPGIVSGPFRKLCSLGEQARATGIDAEVYSFHRWTWHDKHAALLDTDPARAAQYKRFIEQERQSLPEFEFRRLYEAEWTEDEAAVFRGLDGCLTRGDTATTPAGSDRFTVGVDVAQSVDYLCVVSYGIASKRLELRYRVRNVGYPQAARQVDAIVRELKATAIVEENGPGVALIQELRRLGTPLRPFVTTAQSKQELILNLAADVQEHRIKIADQPPMPHEFAIYRYERGSTGLYRYSAPSGEHDDTVMAAALARWGASRAVNLSDYGWA